MRIKAFIALSAIVAAMELSGCDLIGGGEMYKTEPGRTTYRAMDASPDAESTPVPQKVPGESR